MKAPDKIYIAESLIRAPYGNEWSPTEYVSRENTEYIRKDTLLGWAKSYQKEEREGSFLWSCYQIFIDKLNSM